MHRTTWHLTDDPQHNARQALTAWYTDQRATIYSNNAGQYIVTSGTYYQTRTWAYQTSPEELEALLKENEMQACPHSVVSGPCTCCLPEEFAQEERIEEGAHARICPDCNGSALSPYPTDGGSCPHCFGGFLN